MVGIMIVYKAKYLNHITGHISSQQQYFPSSYFLMSLHTAKMCMFYCLLSSGKNHDKKNEWSGKPVRVQIRQDILSALILTQNIAENKCATACR